MLSIFDSLRDITFFSVFFRMILAFVFGGLIGLERSYKNRPAGFRTHILVCIGSTVASMTGLYLYLNLHFPTDISRLGAQVVSGLGFIGAGTIFVTRKRTIKGLTTAAGLWTTGIIGLAVGAGFYEGALITTALVLITETYFSRVGNRIHRTPEFKILVTYQEKTALDHVMRYCKDQKMSISNLQVVSTTAAEPVTYSALITLRPRVNLDQDVIMAHLREIGGIFEIDEVTAL